MTELNEFEKLVREMRTAQRAYFRSREATALETSKRLEREVDHYIKARLEEIEKARLAANMEFDFAKGGANG